MAEISVNTQDGALRAVRCLQSVSKHCCWKLLKSCDFFHPSTLQGAEEEVETKNKNKKSAVDPSRKRKGDDFPQQERRRRDAAETAAGSGTKRRNREQSSAKARRGEERRLCALRRGEGRGGEGRCAPHNTTERAASRLQTRSFCSSLLPLDPDQIRPAARPPASLHARDIGLFGVIFFFFIKKKKKKKKKKKPSNNKYKNVWYFRPSRGKDRG